MGLHQVLCGCQLPGFVGLLTVGTVVSGTFLSSLETLFLLLGYLTQPQYEGFSLAYCIFFCLVWLLSLGDLLYFEAATVGVDLSWRGSGGEGSWSGG